MNPILRRLLSSSIPWCILIFLIVESTLGPIFKRNLTFPESPNRNPYHRFNWPQYVKHPDFNPEKSTQVESERRIIVLGNSQTYGWMLPEDRIWTHLLEEQINKSLQPSESPVRICNWSLVGGNIRHLLLLECSAQQARPDHCLVVITLGTLNPDFPQMERELNPNTYDIAYLLYEESAKIAPARFRSSAGSLNLWIESVCNHLLPTYAYKRAPLSWLANHLPAIHTQSDSSLPGDSQQTARSSIVRIPYFTKPEFEGWFHLQDPALGEKRIPGINGFSDWIQKMGRSWRLGSLKPAEDFFAVMGRSEIPHTVVLMPLCQGDPLIPESDRQLLSFKLNELSKQYQIPVVDLTHSLPPEDFFEPFHLNYYGHEAMADLIREILVKDETLLAVEAKPL